MKVESKVLISTILAKVAECFGLRTLPVVYVTYFTDKDIILSCILYTSARFLSKALLILHHRKITNLSLVLTNGNPYQPLQTIWLQG